MNNAGLVINGHFKDQAVTGVQRYALEILEEFDKIGVYYNTVAPPRILSSDSLRQIWMQAMMPAKISGERLLWSPTNIGPVLCENQVVTLHDIADQLYPEWFSKRYVAWRRLILPRLLSRVKRIITVSEYSRKTIVEQYPDTREKIEVIYNGVCTDHFYPRDEVDVAGITKEYGLDKPFAVTVSSLDPRKNINGLIEAWNRLPDKSRTEMDLVIVGGGAKKFSFNLETEPDDSVRFLGYVEHERLPGLYSAASFFVYPSLFEGFGLPVLEAMACRTPVITSGTTSLKELASGKALTVDPADTGEISSAMQALIESDQLQKEYVEKGYEHARTFSWEKTARQTLDVLEEADR